jgi:RNA polymerase sigma-70 factor (ECF subfamily)
MGGVRAGKASASAESERFERVYTQYFDGVASYLLARTDRETAADTLASTFEVAWRRIAEVPEEPLPWLLGVARRVLANARRSRSRQVALVERMAQATSQRAGEADACVVPAALPAAMAKLTAAQQEALLLIAWEGLSEREAATVLGCTRVAFAARLHRARSRVRAAMTAADNQSPGEQPANPRPTKNPSEEAT